MTRSASTTFRSDIVSTVTDDQGSNNVQRYNYQLNYSLTAGYGTGNPSQTGVTFTQNNIFAFNSGTVPANNSVPLDFNALNASNLGSDYTFNFDKIKGVIIHNQETGVGNILTINATGSDGYTGIFNGGTGNLQIHPEGTFSYIDKFGTDAPSSYGKLWLINDTSSGISYQMVAVGIDESLSTATIPTP